jgi:5'-3' exonuclease
VAAESPPLLLVDAPSLLYRAFFALPTTITDDDGRAVNALLGTANMLLRIVADFEPRAVVLCCGLDAATYRVDLYPPYHRDRPPVPDELAHQFHAAEDFFEAFGWRWHDHDDLEADDLLGSYAAVEADAGGRAAVVTGDRDMFQCAADRVVVLYVRTGAGGVESVDEREVERRYSVPPRLVPDFIALRGDPSDGLPGAPGVGPKTAAALLRDHGSLEAALDAWPRVRPPRVAGALRDNREELLRFKEIATLRLIDVDRPTDASTDYPSAAAAAASHGMSQLSERLRALADEAVKTGVPDKSR